jgi:hypothetical protein
MADKTPCPAHRVGLTVLVTERRNIGVGCNRTKTCTLQAGHPGGCDD